MSHRVSTRIRAGRAAARGMLVLIALLAHAGLAEAVPVNPPFSTFEIPGTTGLGDDFTLSVHASNTESALDFTRLFSSFRGTGPVGTDRIILDYDATGGVIPGLRAIVNNTVVQTGSPPAGIADPGYHHFALTVDSGDVRIYLDGILVANGDVGAGYSNSANLHFGEDPHDGGGSANEQFLGNVDELLVLGRALSAADILALATSTSVSDVVTPIGTELAVYYNFEGGLVDQFAADGQQNGIPRQNATIDGNPANAWRGDASGLLGPAENAPQVPAPGGLGLLGLGLVVLPWVRRLAGRAR